MLKKITIYTDGGARNNPGPAGAGAVVIDDESGATIAKVSQFLGTQTNNWAEYEAVILGLNALKKTVGKSKTRELQVEVRTDSELVARQLSGEYQIKEPNLFPQFIKTHNIIITDFPHISFTHIPREQNKDADALANEAMDSGTT